MRRRIDRVQVARLYAEGMLQREIAAAVGCDHSTISRMLKALNVPVRERTKQYPWPDRGALLDVVATSRSAIEVADRMGLPTATIRAAMKHHGIASFIQGRRSHGVEDVESQAATASELDGDSASHP